MRSSLTRVQGTSPKTDEELHSMRVAAWHRQGILMIRVAEITDIWLRQALENLGNKLFGRRE